MDGYREQNDALLVSLNILQVLDEDPFGSVFVNPLEAVITNRNRKDDTAICCSALLSDRLTAFDNTVLGPPAL
jgi:hypothetical protein